MAFWVRRVYGHGSGPWLIRNDPNLADYRRARPAEFRQLTRPVAQAELAWGMIWDDVVFTNQSPFAVTNVTVSVRLVRGDRTWSDTFTVDRVDAGASHTFRNVFSIPYGRLDQMVMDWSSDQHP